MFRIMSVAIVLLSSSLCSADVLWSIEDEFVNSGEPPFNLVAQTGANAFLVAQLGAPGTTTVIPANSYQGAINFTNDVYANLPIAMGLTQVERTYPVPAFSGTITDYEIRVIYELIEPGYGDYQVRLSALGGPTVVPEPATFGLLAVALVAVGSLRRRR